MNQDDRLGPYRLLRRLGEGGMGVVHLAEDMQGRHVALKVLRPEVAGDELARRRLSREVDTMRRVRSRYIAEVVDADVTGRRPYIVTRYVPGRPLDEVVKSDGALSLEALLPVAYGVAEALAAVHAAGVIHRDLKPGNVLMLDGEPVLIDFGIAQAVDATRLTQTGMFIGTPGYLAPEIIEGQEAGPEVDVHAWAGTMLYAATGQPPFGKGTLEMIFYNITAGKANVDAAPPQLRPLLRAALSREPARRPTAADLVRELGAMLPRRAGTGPVPRRPEEVTTVPDPDRTTPRVGPGSAPTPFPVPQPTPPAEEYVSLLGDPPPPVTAGPGAMTGMPMPPAGGPVSPADPPTPAMGQGDPSPTVRMTDEEPPTVRVTGEESPTVRVTGEQLRDAGLASPPRGLSWDEPTARHPAPPVHPAPPTWQGPAAEGDIPTMRVRPEEAPRYRAPAPPDSSPFADLASNSVFEQTPHVRPRMRPASPEPMPYPPVERVPPPPPPVPVHPGQAPGHVLRRSRAYSVASLLLLVILTAVTVLAPTPAVLVALPVVVLLRAADIAQPELAARRSAGEAAADVFRVLARPAALVKSLGVTLALVPYAVILGLPVTLLLTVLLPGMPTVNTLSWGVAVALWTLCAGPGVEGPGRQMRRTLASMLPARGAAIATSWVLGGVALLTAGIALTTVSEESGQALWQPIVVDDVVSELDRLRDKARSQ